MDRDDGDRLRVGGKPLEVTDVGGGNNRPASEVGDRHDEGIHGQLGADRGGTHDLAGSNPYCRIDGSEFNPLAAHAGEDASVRRPPSNDLCQYCGDRCDRQLPRPISPTRARTRSRRPGGPWAIADIASLSRSSIQPTRRCPRVPSHSSTRRAAHSSVSGGTGPWAASSSANQSSTSARWRRRVTRSARAASIAADKLRGPTSDRSAARFCASRVSVTFSLGITR